MTRQAHGGIHFTDRDGRLLRWINGHGSVTLRQMARWTGVSYQSMQRRVRQLVDHGYLERRAIFHGDRAHWLTKLGHQLCADDLPPPKDIKLGSYRHNHMLVDLSLSLIADLGGRFTPERRVRQIMGFTKFGERYHVPDGWMHVDARKKPIAIELELSTKGSRRLEKIMHHHVFDLDIAEVWYFVESDVVRRHLEKAGGGFASIRIFNVPDDVADGLPKELALA